MHTYAADRTALLVADSYDDFLRRRHAQRGYQETKAATKLRGSRADR
jgi:hypothetical protein